MHPLVDEEFQRNRVSVLQALDLPRYANIQHSVQSAFARLTVSAGDTKASIRDIFDAAESLFKLLITPRNSTLASGSVDDDLKKVVNRAVANEDPATVQAALRAVSGFGKWADACHPYRHGHGTESIVSPPLDLTVLLLSQGAAYIRWLAQIDQALTAAKTG